MLMNISIYINIQNPRRKWNQDRRSALCNKTKGQKEGRRYSICIIKTLIYNQPGSYTCDQNGKAISEKVLMEETMPLSLFCTCHR